MKRGKFIVLEGSDGAGKNTQKNLLVERLNALSIPVSEISFPQYGTPTGDIIGDCYLGKRNRIKQRSWFEDADSVDPKVASLYYAADRLAARSTILASLQNGKNKISDRYVESNMGHQGGKIRDPVQRKELIQWIEELEYGHLELPRPDLVLFLFLPYQVARASAEKRGQLLDGHESNENHLKNAEQCYRELAEMYNWKTIDCMHNGRRKFPEEVHEEIFTEVKKLITYQ